MVLLRHRADDVLDRESDINEVAVAGHVDVLEVMKQARAVVPRHGVGPGHDIVTLEGRHRDDRQVTDPQLGGEVGELGVDPLVDLLRVVDEVHLVDDQHQVRHLEQGGEEGMPTALLDQTPRASTRMSARSGRRGPVTMLRVYWMCPGVSAMMNLRVGVAK